MTCVTAYGAILARSSPAVVERELRMARAPSQRVVVLGRCIVAFPPIAGPGSVVAMNTLAAGRIVWTNTSSPFSLWPTATRNRKETNDNMRWLLNFDMGVVALAMACRFLLPPRTLLAFQFGGIAKGVRINRVAFWSMLVVGA